MLHLICGVTGEQGRHQVALVGRLLVSLPFGSSRTVPNSTCSLMHCAYASSILTRPETSIIEDLETLLSVSLLHAAILQWISPTLATFSFYERATSTSSTTYFAYKRAAMEHVYHLGLSVNYAKWIHLPEPCIS